MLKEPFSGKELFSYYEISMHSKGYHSELRREEAELLYDNTIGRLKKQTWNDMAKLINARMQAEIENVKQNQ